MTEITKIFAKLFEVNGYQILVFIDSDDESEGYLIKIKFIPNSNLVGICTVKLLFDDEDKAQKRFNQLNEDSAFIYVKETIEKLKV